MKNKLKLVLGVLLIGLLGMTSCKKEVFTLDEKCFVFTHRYYDSYGVEVTRGDMIITEEICGISKRQAKKKCEMESSTITQGGVFLFHQVLTYYEK